MSYLYLDDGYPDSMEYENNYFYFNSKDPDVLSRLSQTLQGQNPSDPELRNRITEICQASFHKSDKISELNAFSRTFQNVLSTLFA